MIGHFGDETFQPITKLAMVVTKQTYNTQDKHKKVNPPQTKPNKTKLTPI